MPNKNGDLYRRNQRFFVLAGIVCQDEEDEQKLIKKYRTFLEKYEVDSAELKGTELLKTENEKMLDDFIENMLDDRHMYICCYDKIFYLASMISTLSDVPAFKYGQLLVSNQETEIERAITGEKVKVPAGNRVVVGFDQLAHHLWDGSIQPFSKHIMIGGYSNTGIVAANWERICAEFPVSEMLDEFETQPKDVTDTIKNALEEIGLYE